jgi:hypothetical protein
MPLGRVSRKYLFRKCIMNGLTEELNDKRAFMIGISYIIASLSSFLLADYGTSPIGVGIGVTALWFFLVVYPLLLIYGSVRLGCKLVLRYGSARECEDACLGIDSCIEECRESFGIMVPDVVSTTMHLPSILVTLYKYAKCPDSLSGTAQGPA